MQDDNKTLINYVVENHIMAFEPVTYVTTFKELKNLYEQHKNSDGSDKPTLDRWVTSYRYAACLLLLFIALPLNVYFPKLPIVLTFEMLRPNGNEKCLQYTFILIQYWCVSSGNLLLKVWSSRLDKNFDKAILLIVLVLLF